MVLRKIRTICRGFVLVLLLVAMSVSLTGCAALGPFLAVLGPILSTLGSVGGLVGSIVGIFNPEVGQKISQISGAIGQTGQTFTNTWQQISQSASPNTGTPGTLTTPTIKGASLRDEDGNAFASTRVSSTGGGSMRTSTSGLSGTQTSPGRQTTLAPVSSPSPAGSAPSNAQSLISSGFATTGTKAFDGRLNLTQYAGPSDRTKDKNTMMGIGNRDNKLRSSSLALSPDLISKYGLKGGEAISIQTPQGTRYLGTYDDTTGNRNEPNVIDIYDPTDSLGNDSFMGNVKGDWKLVVGPRS
ncbi:MAG TPA: hypothetical protein PLU72_03850 [Candidatus Ozemobacteraceae bacterium]|nr:hypothetical protein [Candidatus Ozemobacteraceae bacterium]